MGAQKFFKFADYAAEHKATQERAALLSEVKREQDTLKDARGTMSKKEFKTFKALLERERAGTLADLNPEEQKRYDEQLAIR